MTPARDTMRTMRPALTAVVCAVLLTGCAAIDNDRTTVGGQTLSALERSGSSRFDPAVSPSVIGPGRENWEPIEIVVAVDTVQHHPHLTTEQPWYARATPRQRGEHPNAITALDLNADEDAQVAEALAAPLHAGLDVVLALPRLIASGAGPQRSPTAFHERAPRPAPVDSPGLAPETLPIDDRPEGAR